MRQLGPTRLGRGALAFAGALTLAAGFACAGTAAAAEDWAAPLAGAQTALTAGRYDEAYADYRAAAETGNGLAAFTVALFYQLGWGRPVDVVAACDWHQRAATLGVPASQSAFGACLRDGTGRTPDAAAAAAWFERAVAASHIPSLCELGRLLHAGVGVPRDAQRAFQLCEQAAQGGDLTAARTLAEFARAAEPADLSGAAAWLEFAARRDDRQAQLELGILLLGHGQDDATREAGLWWLEHAASKGLLAAYLPLARGYFRGGEDTSGDPIGEAPLAKAYLWSEAYLRRAGEVPDVEAVALHAEVLRRMPASWREDLDAEVSRHIASLGPRADAPLD